MADPTDRPGRHRGDATNRLASDGEIAFDATLADAAAAFASAPAPDVWPEVLARAGTQPRRPSAGAGRWRTLAAASLVLLVALTSVLLLDSGEEPVTLTVAGAPEPTVSSSGDSATPRIEAAGETRPAGDACSEALVDELRRGRGPQMRSGASESLEQLSLTSARVLRGEIVGVEQAHDGGSFLLYELDNGPSSDELADAPGRRATLWTDGNPRTDFRAAFVAFVIDAPIAHQTGEYAALTTHFDGLWVACDNSSPAASFNGPPTGDGWTEALADGPTLDELWDLAAYPDGVFEQEVAGMPFGSERNAFDVRLRSGERLRIVVPSALGDVLRLRERRAPASTILDVGGASAELFFEPCRGHVRPSTDVALTTCWSDEGIRLVVHQSDGRSIATAGWDVEPMRIGPRLPQLEAQYTPRACDRCARPGPLPFPADDVIVFRSDSWVVTGYEQTDLALSWYREFDSPVQIVALDGLVLVDVLDGPLVALDPATGDEQWRVEREPSEGDLVIGGLGDGTVLLGASFDRAGFEAQPALLRRVDVATGEVQWTAEGSSGHRWVPDWPVIVDDALLVLSEPIIRVYGRDPALHRYDAATGRLDWSLSPALRSDEPSGARLVWVEVESGRVVLMRTGDRVVRIDPASGTMLWSVELDAAALGDVELGGTDYDAEGRLAIEVTGRDERVLLDPETGGEVQPA